MPAGRVKSAHTKGLVAQIEWVPTSGHDYTGIYAEGTESALLRLSQTSILHENSSGLFPSMAIKFLLDGQASKNIFAMPNFVGTDSWDFFLNPLSNRVAPFTQEESPIDIDTILKKLVEASEWPYVCAIGHVAEVYDDGTEATDANIPYEIKFTSSIHFDEEKELDETTGEQVMYYDQLKRIEQGSTILEAWGLTAPESLDGEWIKIADINLITPLYTSVFGDERLFFQHVDTTNDRDLWPNAWVGLNEDPKFNQNDADNVWGNEVPTGEFGWPEDAEEAEARYLAQIDTYSCPFAWLLDLN
jgi:hypothetical protein